MGSSRRFLNLIVNNRITGARSLRSIDLMREQFFNTTTPVAGCQEHKQAAGEALKMEKIWLPSPSFSILSSATSNGWTLECIPLAGHKVFCTDRSGRTIFFDASTPHAPRGHHAHSPEDQVAAEWPISIFIPSDAADNHDDVECSVFVMESVPEPELRCSGQLSSQFEAFVCRKPNMPSTNPWHHLLLPPPPFVCDPKYRRPPKISSYAVVGGGSGSSSQRPRYAYPRTTEGAGAYSLDTVCHTWSQMGESALPFYGKVEYVPELKLWFGISSKDWSLAAAALSANPPWIPRRHHW
ncbi:unnamed protein product [Urochloa humidicola]